MNVVYTTSTIGARRKASRLAAMRLLALAHQRDTFLDTTEGRDWLMKVERLAVGEEFCHVCRRATDHGGEHTDAQLQAWAERPGMLQSLLG